MKIAQIAPPWISVPPRTYGGTESIIAFLVDELMSRGHDVTLFAPGDARTSAKLISFYPKSLISEETPWEAHLKAYYHLHNSLQYADEFDVVHTHVSSTADMYIFPLLASVARPHVTTLHSNFPFDRVGSWVGNADDLFLEWIAPAPVVTVSKRAHANLPNGLSVAGVVHLGIPMPDRAYTSGARDDYLVWLGKFVPEKGPHVAIEAARRAGVPLVLAGIVDLDVRKSVEYFTREVEPHIDNDRIRYIGPVDLQQKTALLSRARGMLFPIDWEEPGATVVLEAMALGCPVVGFPRGVLPELVVHGLTGFIPRDIDEMVRDIGRLGEISNCTVRDHAEHNFSVTIMADKYLQIYEKLCASSRPPEIRL